jgi:ABC-2 type transport system ATP-binding protein
MDRTVPTAIETDRLTKRFRSPRSLRAIASGRAPEPERTAVDEVSLSVARGEVFGLLGQNGAGKTTLVRMLTTLLLPTSGSGHVDGLDITRDPRAIRARVGLVNGDERSFYWRLTGRQNLEFFGALRHLTPAATAAAVDRLAARLGLSDHLDRRFGTLSSGQRQGLAIVRGLLGDPAILFMDEPTRSLDPISADRLRRFVADVVVGELGHTVVLATHSMPEAEALCDRLAFIQDGRIVAAGSVAELRRAIGYGTRCTLRLRDVPTELPARLARIPGTAAITAELLGPDSPDGATTVVRLDLRTPDALPAVLRDLVDGGVSVLACETGELSLEAIYLHTLGGSAGPLPTSVPAAVR